MSAVEQLDDGESETAWLKESASLGEGRALNLEERAVIAAAMRQRQIALGRQQQTGRWLRTSEFR